MTHPIIFRLVHDRARELAAKACRLAPDGWIMTIKPATRSLDQNAKLWPMLQDIAAQVEWYGSKLTDEEWKDVFTAALKKSKVVPGIDGGFVVCGQRTSNMSKADFSELIELISAFAAQKNVKWTNEQGSPNE